MTDELKLVLCGCGGKAEIVKRFSPDYDLDVYYAKCKNCGIETDDYFFESEAIMAWNIAVGRELERKKGKCTKINCPIQMNYISNDCDIKTCPYRTEHKNGEDINPALTWEELKQMEGKPVWVEADDGKYKRWFIVGNFFSWFEKEDFDAHVNLYRSGGAMEMSKETYGFYWQAYKKERK